MAYIEKQLSLETVDLAKGNEAVAIFANDDACSEVLEKLNSMNIRRIAVRAAGYDNVYLKKASELSFKIANVPVYSPNAIAEHAITLILSLNRRIILSSNKVKSYNFLLDDLIGFEWKNCWNHRAGKYRGHSSKNTSWIRMQASRF